MLVKLEEVGIQIERGNRSRVCELYWDLSYSLRFHTIGLSEECEWCGVAPGVALPQRGGRAVGGVCKLADAEALPNREHLRVGEQTPNPIQYEVIGDCQAHFPL